MASFFLRWVNLKLSALKASSKVPNRLLTVSQYFFFFCASLIIHNKRSNTTVLLIKCILRWLSGCDSGQLIPRTTIASVYADPDDRRPHCQDQASLAHHRNSNSGPQSKNGVAASTSRYGATASASRTGANGKFYFHWHNFDS